LLKRIGHIRLLVRDYDEALGFYTEKFGFVKTLDGEIGPGIRELAVSPSTDDSTVIRFEEPSRDDERSQIETQLPNRLVQLVTDNMDETYRQMKSRGVSFGEEPQEAPWGKQALIKDLYGNMFDLLDPAKM
jgi:predicted enzyme related to lactoylglutathione lyase